jgi:alkylation response protein AidB-like acyl-CoA dehydrogenase
MNDVTADQIESVMRTLQDAGALSIPLPASGSTALRLRALYELARRDLSVARIAEAHTDAIAILGEARYSAISDALYGVWASDGPSSRLQMTRLTTGKLRLDGIKQYCSGAPFLDHALVTAHAEGARWLIALPLNASGLSVEPSDWAASAFAATGTSVVRFDNVILDDSHVVGAPNWYLERVGFWHGATGPAACWAGGAAGLVDAALRLNRRDAHSRAQMGALEAAAWGLLAILDQAAAQIDADPNDRSGSGQRLALTVRHLIERSCTDILDRFGRATGPQLLAFDTDTVRRYSELTLYIRQCHAERDLESLANCAPAAETEALVTSR